MKIKSILLIVFCSLISCINIHAQDICPTEDLKIIRQSQLDSFLILYPDCNTLTNTIAILGSDITSLEALKNIKNVNFLEISQTKITSLHGLDSLKKCLGNFVLKQNNLLTDLKLLKNLHYAHWVSLLSNDLIVDYSGLSGDSLNIITLLGNKNIKNLKGLNSSYCSRLEIYDTNLNSLAGHELLNLKTLVVSNINTLDSINFSRLVVLYINNCSRLNSVTPLDNLTSLKKLDSFSNRNLSACSTELICSKIDDPDFKLILADNAAGCNTKEQIRNRCLSDTGNIQEKQQIQIYPQPINSDMLFVTGLTNHTDYQIIDLQGQTVQMGVVFSYVDITALLPGFYILHLYQENKNNAVKSFKIVRL